MLSRRWVLRTLTALVVLGSFRSIGAIAADGDAKANPAGVSLEGPPSRDTFRSLVNQEFSLLLDNRAASLSLVRVEDDVARGDGEQFTATFRGPHGLVLQEGVYRIAHATAGTTELFLQPAGNDPRYNYYKASFNLPRDRISVPPPTRDRGRGWRFVP